MPDELTNKIVKDRLAMDDAKNGWILDGYPRNASQVKALDAMLEELGTPLDKVVALDADHDVLMQRIAKRAQEQGRSDDTPRPSPSVWPRTPKETAPLLDIYKSRGQLVAIDGVGDIDAIQANIVAALSVGCRCRSYRRQDARITSRVYNGSCTPRVVGTRYDIFFKFGVSSDIPV